MTETAEPPSRESQLRAARLRALATIGVMVILGASGYFLCRSSFGISGGACRTASDCDDLGGVCLHAPTGAYCTRSCNHDEDCDPGTHCEIPPWEKEKTTDAFCLHDTKIGH